MLNFSASYSDMATRILFATQTLIAKDGIQNISMHKVAKQAGISVGTIYLHFKDKEDLLNQLIHFLFLQYHRHFLQNYDPKLPLYEQYCQFWKSHWLFLQQNPDAVINIYQYEALPQFHKLCRYCSEAEHLPYNRFITQGKQQQAIVNLPTEIIYTLSLQVLTGIAYSQIVENKRYDEKILEDVMNCTWKAITN
ncbi:TetR/AcrR family transcriptional regulator [Phocoenobacter skyensis]|uniref:TetR/AcrR family transcriptional regulator n=1 Tax=Phocoenobacter skyensis TaxID=97481 RepID=A0A1H7WDB3_9PAST|nr:TetR/AcrR family transcriptional regulator [Pasteurella skyensis]MDP8079184.1 TetR/AcrR family transcriptional regulator [Pasteurella skyensis]MDP8085206.1 TetR/AcrR family transcriptional regulator [Pasteurella skyensis]MDP8162170.1 TetR/AcrR family transcriptional regulator [Pasteurella skyensis]MDP8169993.1 TetR/AcrR family transcriptional regulator [Pasteurella skyensis]MDP8173029.1 TetR/AcrR family transcriptional regulator [Pasteurella skyensis]